MPFGQIVISKKGDREVFVAAKAWDILISQANNARATNSTTKQHNSKSLS
jgi:hypothetical protein